MLWILLIYPKKQKANEIKMNYLQMCANSKEFREWKEKQRQLKELEEKEEENLHSHKQTSASSSSKKDDWVCLKNEED